MVSSICLGGRIPPRDLPLWRTTVASGATGTPLLAQKGRQSQLERFPDPLPLPPELPERPVDRGKGLAVVAALIRLVSRLRVSLVAVTRRLLLPGSRWRVSQCACQTVSGVGPAVALCWSLRDTGRVQGLVDEGIVGGCTSLVECRIQECSGGR